MDILVLLIAISLVVIGLVIWLFFRMSASGQFEDLEAPARRILLDDDRPRPPKAPAAPTPELSHPDPLAQSSGLSESAASAQSSARPTSSTPDQ